MRHSAAPEKYFALHIGGTVHLAEHMQGDVGQALEFGFVVTERS